MRIMIANMMMNIMMKKMIQKIKIFQNPKHGMRSIMILIENFFQSQLKNNLLSKINKTKRAKPYNSKKQNNKISETW